LLAWFPQPKDATPDERIAATAAAFRTAEMLTYVIRALTKRETRKRAKGNP
jgi:hypothetical protein